MRRTIILATVFISFLFSAVPQTAYALEQRLYDVAIIGAGSGGCSAAIQAARMG
ncbi:MAG: hypothetical protein GX672_02475, partial [Synergistaceae bacterium]|nr:hypothetical protein [Synergistaceae bacterium]